MIQVFVSHSSRDEQIASRLITLIRSALNLPAADIRCTSVDGYRLPAGTPFEEKLRHEICDSKVLVALITRHSTSSLYVPFELGGRWAASKPLLPLVVGGGARDLAIGPLSLLNVLRCDDEPQLFQFISDLAAALQQSIENPAVYHKQIAELIAAAKVEFSNNTSNALGAEHQLPTSVSRYYYVVASSTGKVLDTRLSPYHLYPGPWDVHQVERLGLDNQLWCPVQTVEGFYHLFVKHTGTCLDVRHSAQEDRAMVIAHPFNSTDAQSWEMRDAGDGCFYLIARHSRKALQFDEYGDAIYQFTFHGSDNQKWKFQPAH